jgi:hypothetical protein
LKLTSAKKLGKAIRFRANHNFTKATSADCKIQPERLLAARPAHHAHEGLDSGESFSPNLGDDMDLRLQTQKMTHDIKADDNTPDELYDVDPYVCFHLLVWPGCMLILCVIAARNRELAESV